LPGGQKSIGLLGSAENQKDVTKGMVSPGIAPASGYSPAVSPGSSPQALHSAPSVQVLEQPKLEMSEVAKIAQARIKGYEGDPCPSCGSFTLIRNGTCMKCHTCGGTTGCS
jgi:ribonucleoside-diphosphate reductase alpha chain